MIEVAALAGGFTLHGVTSLHGTLARVAVLATSVGLPRPFVREAG